MKKRILSFLLVAILAVTILPTYASAAGSLSNFSKINTYTAGLFKDVPTTQWYADEVQFTYEYNLFNGKTTTTFAPDSNLNLSEAIKLAAVMHSYYNTGTLTLSPGSPVWYQPYVDYALQNGIIPSSYPNYEANATRSDFAKIFAAALPEEALPPKNTIEDNTIPDVKISYDYGPAVYLLYRAGVLTGSPGTHAYNPLDNIKRSEVAAIVARMASSSFREAFSISGKDLSSTEIAAKCSPAVFSIDLLSKTGTSIGSGSGFFISSSGLAVTNYHVIQNMTSAKITTKDGQTYDITGVVDYNVENDLALIQVNGIGFPYLNVGNSDSATTGANIYAIGYPLGIGQTVTPGAITNASHVSDGINYIMINASISSGSSGGALIDSKGNVIGVTSAYYSGGQNLNLAVPINLLSSLSKTKTPVSLATLFAKTFTYYASFPTVPDFATVTGVSLDSQHYNPQYQAQYFYYSFSGSSVDAYDTMYDYMDQLDFEGFDYQGYATVDGGTFFMFIDPSNSLEIVIGVISVYGVDVVAIGISPK